MDEAPSTGEATNATNATNYKMVAAIIGPVFFLCCLAVSIVLFAGKKLCSLSRVKSMKPIVKIGHMFLWGYVVSMGLLLSVFLVSSGIFYLMTQMGAPNDSARMAMGIVSKSTLQSVMGVFLCSIIVSSTLAVVLAISNLEKEFDAIDMVVINAAVQFVALITWTARLAE